MNELNIEGVKALRAAVVRQACDDYLTLLKTPKGRICYDIVRGRKKFENKQTLTQWFHSPEFSRWCNAVTGEEITEQLRQNHAAGFRYHAYY